MGSCTSYEVNDIESEKISKFTIIMPQFQTDGIHSRSDITMGEYPNISSKWADGDSIGIFPNIGDQLSFRITASGDGKSCAFDGGGWALKPSSFYTAYSPFKRSYYYQDKDELLINMLNQKQIGNNSTQHLGAYDIKIATGTKPADGGISFVMERKVALVRMDLTAPTAATWSSITLESDALFTTEATMDLSSSTPTLTPKTTSNTISLGLSGVTTTSDNKNIIAYMMLLPVDLTGKSLNVKITDSTGNTYSTEASIVKNRTNFTANGARWIEAKLFQKKVSLSKTERLSQVITDKEKYEIKSLTITGELNGDDILYLREMAGVDVKGYSTGGVLTNLDIRNANIIEGGGYYFAFETSSLYAFYTKTSQISDYMFYGTKLEEIILPLNTTSIGLSSFHACYKLKGISIPSNVVTIEENAFGGCSNLTSIEIPYGVTTIGSAAFQNCTGLTSIKLSETVNSISTSAFNGIHSLAFEVADNNNTYSTINGVLFSKDKTTLIRYCLDQTNPNYTIPNTTTLIGDDAFYGCNKLSSITIPNTVKAIGARAFESSGISEIDLPNSVEIIGNASFKSCSKLTSVTLNEGLKEIGGMAFGESNSLKTIIIPNSVTSLTATFYNNKGITSVTLSNNLTTLGANTFKGCTNIASVLLPESLIEIKGGAFSGTSITTLTIPKNVTTIDCSAFDNTNITSLHCNTIIPPDTGYTSFSSTFYESCKLYVPKGYISVYRNVDNWKYFKYIEEE